MSSKWFTDFNFSDFNSFFDVDELEWLYNEVKKKLNEEEKNNKKCDKKCKDDEVESYKHFDKKVYKGDELVDHVEKEYKNGKCVKDIHNCCEKPCVEHLCNEDKEEQPKIKKLSCQKNDIIMRDQYTEILSLQKEIDRLNKENCELKNKLNKIKNIF